MTERIKGVLAPVLTPFNASLEPDAGRFIAHCRWLVDNRAALAIFGTNSEAVSLSVDERLALTDALLEAGIPAAKLMPGTGACSLSDAVTLTRARRAKWRGGRADGAAVLLQGRFRRRRVRVLLGGDRARRRRAAGRLSVPHSPTHAGPHHARIDRTPAEALPKGCCRRQGLVGGLEQLEGDDRHRLRAAASTCSPPASRCCRNRWRSAEPAASARR